MFPEVVRSRIRGLKLSRPTCMRAGASRTWKSLKFAKSHLIWNDFLSVHVTKLPTPQWTPVVNGLTGCQLRPFPLLWYVCAMELFSCWSKNGINETAKMAKIGSIFAHKISYLEKYSNHRPQTRKRSASSSYLNTPSIGLDCEAIPFAHERTRNFNLRK